MDHDDQLRQQIVDVGRRMYDKGLIAAADGNVTVRTADERLYVTPTGRCKGDLTAADIVITDRTGKLLSGAGRPSSELDMHMAIYEVRPDVFAVCHAHPPLATGFAAAGVPLSPALLSEIVLTLGCVPITEYATPTTRELADTVRANAPHYDALLLANHGAVTFGKDVWDAYYKMETLEHYAKINLVTKVLGRERPIPEDAVAKLVELRRTLGLRATDPYCALGPPTPTPVAVATPMTTAARDTVTLTPNELVELMVQVLGAS